MSERGRGTIVSWHADRHFGWIKPDDPARRHAVDLFCHATAIRAFRPPTLQTRVSYLVGRDRFGRVQARDVEIETDS